jgi:hypothetical protein
MSSLELENELFIDVDGYNTLRCIALAGGRKPGRESTASDPPGALCFSLVLLQMTSGIVCCRCQPHCEIKETCRLAIEKSVGREGLDGGYRTP